jgi:hypothetical protein
LNKWLSKNASPRNDNQKRAGIIGEAEQTAGQQNKPSAGPTGVYLTTSEAPKRNSLQTGLEREKS